MRADRMIESASEYLQYSAGYIEIQKAIAADLDLIATTNEDIAAQRRIRTATWGLRYWEQKTGIPTILNDSIEVRRSRVLAKWRGTGQFSVALIKSVAEAFSGGEVEVEMDIPNYHIYVTFTGKLGIPPNIEDLKSQLDNIIHAHLGLSYKFTYHTYAIMKASGLTYAQLKNTGLTYRELTTTSLLGG